MGLARGRISVVKLSGRVAGGGWEGLTAPVGRGLGVEVILAATMSLEMDRTKFKFRGGSGLCQPKGVGKDSLMNQYRHQSTRTWGLVAKSGRLKSLTRAKMKPNRISAQERSP